jgi:hypothetical protein
MQALVPVQSFSSANPDGQAQTTLGLCFTFKLITGVSGCAASDSEPKLDGLRQPGSGGRLVSDSTSRGNNIQLPQNMVQREVRYIMIVGKHNKNIYNQGTDSAT